MKSFHAFPEKLLRTAIAFSFLSWLDFCRKLSISIYYYAILVRIWYYLSAYIFIVHCCLQNTAIPQYANFHYVTHDFSRKGLRKWFKIQVRKSLEEHCRGAYLLYESMRNGMMLRQWDKGKSINAKHTLLLWIKIAQYYCKESCTLSVHSFGVTSRSQNHVALPCQSCRTLFLQSANFQIWSFSRRRNSILGKCLSNHLAWKKITFLT